MDTARDLSARLLGLLRREQSAQADFLVAAVRDYRDLPYYFGVQTISRVFRRGVEITPERN